MRLRRRVSENDRLRVLTLLETLREHGSAPEIDVEAAVSRRLRSLPREGLWAPMVSLREFFWGAAVAAAMLAIAAAGLVGALSPQWLTSPGRGVESVAKGGGALLAAVWGVARSGLRGVLDFASRYAGAADYVDGALAVAAQAALLAFAAMLVLTVLVVSHEARSRRIAG